MVTDKPTALRRHRAVTLIEAVLYIAIALALIVGGLVFFQQASTAAKTSATVRQLSASLAEARILVKDELEETGLVDITRVLIAAGAVPPDMVKSATELSNPFGGETKFSSMYDSFGNHVIFLELSNVPQGVCARLLTATSGSDFQWLTGAVGITTVISYGYTTGSVTTPGLPGEFRGHSMNPTQAGWMCKYGSENYPDKTTEPTSTPLSGNVKVEMFFLVDR